MAREISWFGGASIALSYCLDLLVIFVPPVILAVILGATVFPALSDALFGLLVSQPKRPPAIPTAIPKRAPAGITWGGIGKAMAVMFALTASVAGVLYVLNVREKSLGVYKLNLDAAQSALPGRIGFIQVTGHAGRRLAFTYTDRSTVSLIIPVTSTAWTPAEPVRFFVHYNQLGSSAEQLRLPSEFREPGAATFGGSVEGKLPVFVEQAYASKGIKIDPSYKVVGWQQLSPNEAPMSESHIIALGVGGLIF